MDDRLLPRIRYTPCSEWSKTTHGKSLTSPLLLEKHNLTPPEQVTKVLEASKRSLRRSSLGQGPLAACKQLLEAKELAAPVFTSALAAEPLQHHIDCTICPGLK